jgi:hypothetical protein
MKEDERAQSQKELVKRIASITTRLVPDREGIELRFINHETTFSKPNMNQIEIIMSDVRLDGWTEIGTNLRRKILEPLVREPLNSRRLSRPLLISIITDGHPTKESEDSLKNAILECGRLLQTNGYNPEG